MFPSIFIQFENGWNEFYFKFNQPGCSRKDKTKKHNQTPVMYRHESEGNTKIKLKKISYLFFQFSENGVGRVSKTKNKKALA